MNCGNQSAHISLIHRRFTALASRDPCVVDLEIFNIEARKDREIHVYLLDKRQAISVRFPTMGRLGSLHLAHVVDVAMANGSALCWQHSGHGDSLSGEGGELHLVRSGIAMDVDNCSDFPDNNPSLANSLVSTTQSCSLIMIPQRDTR